MRSVLEDSCKDGYVWAMLKDCYGIVLITVNDSLGSAVQHAPSPPIDKTVNPRSPAYHQKGSMVSG